MAMTDFERRQAERQLLAYDAEAREAGRATFWWLAGSVVFSVFALLIGAGQVDVLALLAFMAATMAAIACAVMSVVFGFGGAVAVCHHGKVWKKLDADRRPQTVAPAGLDVLES